jgi:hypothetical protein
LGLDAKKVAGEHEADTKKGGHFARQESASMKRILALLLVAAASTSAQHVRKADVAEYLVHRNLSLPHPLIETILARFPSKASYAMVDTFPGLDVSQMANACIQQNLGVLGQACDMSKMSGPGQLSQEIDLGDAAGDEITLILPPKFTWVSTSAFSGGKSCLIKQYDHTFITGFSGQLRGEFQNGSGEKAIYALYCNTGPGNYRAENFVLYNPKWATASGVAMLLTGSLDNSMFRNIEVGDANDAIAGIQFNFRMCCGAAFINITSNSFYTGPVPVDVEGTNAGTVNGVLFSGLSAVHPAPGLPNFKCNDTSVSMNTTVWITALYEEGSNDDLDTPMNQVTGCGSITVMGEDIKAETANSIAPAWYVGNQTPTSLQIVGSAQPLNFVRPATVIVYNAVAPACPTPPCTIVTDKKGFKGFWSSD